LSIYPLKGGEKTNNRAGCAYKEFSENTSRSILCRPVGTAPRDSSALDESAICVSSQLEVDLDDPNLNAYLAGVSLSLSLLPLDVFAGDDELRALCDTEWQAATQH
jgi:hypothetical protein